MERLNDIFTPHIVIKESEFDEYLIKNVIVSLNKITFDK